MIFCIFEYKYIGFKAIYVFICIVMKYNGFFAIEFIFRLLIINHDF